MAQAEVSIPGNSPLRGALSLFSDDECSAIKYCLKTDDPACQQAGRQPSTPPPLSGGYSPSGTLLTRVFRCACGHISWGGVLWQQILPLGAEEMDRAEVPDRSLLDAVLLKQRLAYLSMGCTGVVHPADGITEVD